MSFISEPLTLKDILASIGVTPTLCLDAADRASWSGSGTTWNDVSGNGYHFLRGATGSGSDAPVFSGNVGEAANACFTFDGTQFFRLNQANPAFINNMHKANAKFTVIALWYAPDGAVSYYDGVSNLFGSVYGDTGGNPATSLIGVVQRIACNNTNQNYFRVGNGTTTVVFSEGAGNPSTLETYEGDWDPHVTSVDIAASTIAFLQGDRSTVRSAAAYASPTASGASQVLEVGASGNANGIAPNGNKIACFAIIDGVALTVAQQKEVAAKLRLRLGGGKTRKNGLQIVGTAMYPSGAGPFAWPPGTQAGDLVLISQEVFNSAGIPAATPATPGGGFTQIGTDLTWLQTSPQGLRQRWCAKIVDAADITAGSFSGYITTASPTTGNHVGMVAVRGVDTPISAWSVGQFNQQVVTSPSQPTPQTISVNGLSGRKLMFGWTGGGSGNLAFTFTGASGAKRHPLHDQNTASVYALLQPDDVASSDIAVACTIGAVANQGHRLFSGYLNIT